MEESKMTANAATWRLGEGARWWGVQDPNGAGGMGKEGITFP